MNPYTRYHDNPGPSDEPPTLEGDEPYAKMHTSLWRFLLHLDKRQAVTDERVRFNTWVVTAVVGIDLAILGYMIGN